MFFLFKGDRDFKSKSEQRAFRPSSDALESREVLSTIIQAPSTAHPTALISRSTSGLNILTQGMVASSLHGGHATAVTGAKTTLNVAGIVSSVIPAPAVSGIIAPRTISSGTTTSTTASATKSLPRLGGFNPSVNTAASLKAALNALRGLTTVISSTSAIPSVVSTTTSSTGSSISNTNTSTTLAQQAAASGYYATTGLAFTNYLNSTLPTSTTLIGSNQTFTSTGLNGSSITIGGSGITASPFGYA